MMYKTETIRQAARLLDAVKGDDDPVIEVYFNDDKNQIEVWNMLANREHMIAQADYCEDQREASPPPSEKPNPEMGFGGSLIPVLLRGLSLMCENNRNLMSHEFIFNAEKEELHIESYETGMIDLIVPY